MAGLKGVHPRLVTPPPDPRPSLAMLPALAGLGDDFAWAVWYSVWKASAAGEDVSVPTAGGDATGDRFRAAIDSVPELREDLEVLGRFAAGYEAPRFSSDALIHVADWAAAQAYPEPAIQCAEAAAALVPGSARRALAAGRMNRLFGEVARAELFYERAIALARRTRNWRVYVRAHLGKGQVKKSLGDSEAARAHYFTAARAARNLSGEKWLAAQTQHDLLGLAAEAGAFEDALEYARRALNWYPRHHSSVPALAHDLGFMLVRMNEFAVAVPLLEAAIPLLQPKEQVIGWSTIARAAAGAADTQGYRRATENMLRLVGLFDSYAVAAFANLACGAHRLELWSDAEQYAIRSLEIAEHRLDAEAVIVAREVLAAVCTRSRAPVETMLSKRHRVDATSLSTEMIAHLVDWRGPTWKRKRQSDREHLGLI